MENQNSLQKRFISEADIGPISITGQHSHAGDMGKAKDLHDHALEVMLTFRSLNKEGVTIILDMETETALRGKVEQFFKTPHPKTSMEKIARDLFADIDDAIPDLKVRLGKKYGRLYDFQLQKVEITADYDGSLDHPELPMCFRFQKDDRPLEDNAGISEGFLF